MSRQFRYRVTAIVLGGLIFGAPMIANGTANADQFSESGRQVTFSGEGMLGLSCRSEPDVESLTVPANSTILVVNRTGHDAMLQLGGDTKGTLESDAATEVIFRRGTTAVSLNPSCATDDETQPVMVTASPSASAARPDPIPPPTRAATALSATAPDSDKPTRTKDSKTGGNSVMSAGGSTSSGGNSAKATRSNPDRTGDRRTTTTTTTTTSSAGGAAAILPQGEAPTRITPGATTGRPGVAGATAPAYAGMPLNDRKAVVPGTPTPTAPVDGPLTAEAPPVAQAQIAAAEPVAMMAPIPDRGPVGLLAVIAAVCVLGVGIATIRAIVSQRANRANMA